MKKQIKKSVAAKKVKRKVKVGEMQANGVIKKKRVYKRPRLKHDKSKMHPNSLANLRPARLGEVSRNVYGANGQDLISELKRALTHESIFTIVDKLKKLAEKGDLKAVQILLERLHGPLSQFVLHTEPQSISITHNVITVEEAKRQDAATMQQRIKAHEDGSGKTYN